MTEKVKCPDCAKLSIAVEALRVIHESFWDDNEPLDERVSDLKSLALTALNSIAET